MNFSYLTDEKAKLAQRILEDGVIDGDEALRLGKEIFEDGVVSAEEVDLLFHLDASAPDSDHDEAWERLFVNALTDYYVWKQFPPGVLAQQGADHLVRRITADGKINGKTEFSLLRNIAKTAKLYPENVAMLLLRAVKDEVLEGVGGTLFGPERQRAGTIDLVDVEIIRDAIYAVGSGYTVTRNEAELLFELNDATSGAKNAHQWQDLFAKGVGNYLIFPRETPKILSYEGYAKSQEWLAVRGSSEDFIKAMGASLLNGDAIAQAFDTAAEYLPFGTTQEEKDLIAKLDEEAVVADKLSKVDEAEAKWLLERVNADGEIDENERAMLAFVKENALSIHPSLDPLLKAAGL